MPKFWKFTLIITLVNYQLITNPNYWQDKLTANWKNNYNGIIRSLDGPFYLISLPKTPCSKNRRVFANELKLEGVPTRQNLPSR
jgi:hypothetical protein